MEDIGRTPGRSPGTGICDNAARRPLVAILIGKFIADVAHASKHAAATPPRQKGLTITRTTMRIISTVGTSFHSRQ
jgi:hypothetical protein